MTSVSKIKSPISSSSTSEDDADLRRGPWTLEEDTLLIHYIARHSEGRWNLLAKRAGLRRTGKSCRLRWLNYLKPDVKRGNLSPQEQLLILDLHSKWGNRWSKIAQHLPGRTDNEIKNYWRTRVQKQARHLKIDANSTTFQDLIRCFWIPRLLQKIEGSTPSPTVLSENQIISQPAINFAPQIPTLPPQLPQKEVPNQAPIDLSAKLQGFEHHEQNSDSEHCTSSCISSAESMNNNISLVSHPFSGYPTSPFHCLGSNNIDYSNFVKDYYYVDSSCYDIEAMNLGNMSGPGGFATNPAGDHHAVAESNWGFGSDLGDGMWNMDELWQFRNLQQRET